MPKTRSTWAARAVFLLLSVLLLVGAGVPSWGADITTQDCAEAAARSNPVPPSCHGRRVLKTTLIKNKQGQLSCRVEKVEYVCPKPYTHVSLSHQLEYFPLGDVYSSNDASRTGLQIMAGWVNTVFGDEPNPQLEKARKFVEELAPKTPLDVVILAIPGAKATRIEIAVGSTLLEKGVAMAGKTLAPLSKAIGEFTSVAGPAIKTRLAKAIQEWNEKTKSMFPEKPSAKPRTPLSPGPFLYGEIGIPTDAVKEGEVVFGIYQRPTGPGLEGWAQETKTKTAADYLGTDLPYKTYEPHPVWVAAFDKAKSEGVQVHFDLNNLRIRQALENPFGGLTSAELDWLSLHWSEFKEHIVRPKFWREGRETKPPWEWANPDVPEFLP